MSPSSMLSFHILKAKSSPKIGEILTSQTGWIIAEKTRQGSSSSYASIQELIVHLKSGTSTAKGGGAVYRILSFEEVVASDDRLQQEIAQTLALFRPIMQMLQPTFEESQFASNMVELAGYAEEIPAFDPEDDAEGKKKVLKEIAVRQGQAKFRTQLLEAYKSQCAISGCAIEPILQAAHISPYNGAKSNHVSNGILLRADIHTLFDLGLLKIDPNHKTVIVAPILMGSEYEAYADVRIAEPDSNSQRPSRATFAKKMTMFQTD